jgi:3-oxoacyl-[acyl-carrier protein] reductase
LRPGSWVVVFSSGAALGGSPLSGGYAGATAAQRFVTAYAHEEAKRANLAISFSAILPLFSPQTRIGSTAVEAYAIRAGLSSEDYLQSFAKTVGPLVTPEVAGDAVVKLVGEVATEVSSAYRLTGAGLHKLT